MFFEWVKKKSDEGIVFLNDPKISDYAKFQALSKVNFFLGLNCSKKFFSDRFKIVYTVFENKIYFDNGLKIFEDDLEFFDSVKSSSEFDLISKIKQTFNGSIYM
jgi:hypothetical protein